MDLLMLILVVALIGAGVWAIVTYIPMPPMLRTAIIVFAVIVLVLYLINTLGGALPNVLPRNR